MFPSLVVVQIRVEIQPERRLKETNLSPHHAVNVSRTITIRTIKVGDLVPDYRGWLTIKIKHHRKTKNALQHSLIFFIMIETVKSAWL
jgi:hypothetical protein